MPQVHTLRAMLLALDYASGLDSLLKSEKTDPVAEIYALIDSTTPTVYREALALLFCDRRLWFGECIHAHP